MTQEIVRYELEGVGTLARITVSGAGDFWPIASDEAKLLSDYRTVRNAGRGALFIEFIDQRVSKYEVRLGGDVPLFNLLLHGDVARKLRD